MARLHSKWIGNVLRFFQGSTTIAEIDGDNSCVDIKSMKLNGTAVTATAAELNALDLSGAVVAVTATADGLTTGIIPDGGLLQHVQVTSANADHIVTLPSPTPGRQVIINVGANGFELRSSAPATVAINGGAEADAESAIAANSTVLAICITATAWKAIFLDADADVAKVAAAAAA